MWLQWHNEGFAAKRRNGRGTVIAGVAGVWRNGQDNYGYNAGNWSGGRSVGNRSWQGAKAPEDS